MFIETPNGTFINLMKMEMVGAGSNQTEAELKAGAEFSNDSICAWPAYKLEGQETRAHTLLDMKRNQDPLLWEWVNFNFRASLIKRHWFVSMKDVLVAWTLRRQDCLNRMNAEQKLLIPANLGPNMGRTQQPNAQSSAKSDKALYESVEQFMDEIGLEQSSPIRLHFASKKASGFDELAAFLAPIIAESKKVSTWSIMDQSYQAENGKTVSPYKINSSISKLQEAWAAMTVNYAKPDHSADQIVTQIKEGDLSQQQEPSIMSAEAESSQERELQTA